MSTQLNDYLTKGFTVAVDIDNTMNDFSTKLSEELGVDMTQSLYIKDMTDMTETEITDFLMDKGPMLHMTAPIKDEHTIPVLHQMCEDYDTIILTRRNRKRLQFDVKFATEVFFQQHGLYDKLMAIAYCEESKQTVVSQGDVQIDVLIDDNHLEAMPFLELNVPVILFDYPYNRHVKHPLLYRVHSWDEVPAILKELKERKVYE